MFGFISLKKHYKLVSAVDKYWDDALTQAKQAGAIAAASAHEAATKSVNEKFDTLFRELAKQGVALNMSSDPDGLHFLIFFCPKLTKPHGGFPSLQESSAFIAGVDKLIGIPGWYHRGATINKDYTHPADLWNAADDIKSAVDFLNAKLAEVLHAQDIAKIRESLTEK